MQRSSCALAALLLLAAATRAAAINSPQALTSDPSPLVLNVESTKLVNLTLTAAVYGNFTCSIEDTAIANVSEFQAVSGGWPGGRQQSGNATFAVELQGRKFGWTFLVCGTAKLQVTVLKPTGVLDILYRVLLIVQIGLAAGQLIKLALPNFVNPNALAFGFLTYGCAPGGSGSNTYTFMLDGDLELSIALTFFANISTFFMLPLWLFVYGRLYIDSSQVVIPFDQVAYTLLQSVIPLALGVLVRFKWPQVGKKITKAIAPLVVLFIVTVAGLGSYIYLYLLELLVKYPLVFPFAAMLPWSSFLFAYLIAVICRLPRPQMTSVAMSGVQNAGIPIQLLLYSMPKPDGDIGSIVPVAAAILTPVPVYLAVLAYRIRKRLRARAKTAQPYGSVEMTDDGGGVGGGGGSEGGDGGGGGGGVDGKAEASVDPGTFWKKSTVSPDPAVSPPGTQQDTESGVSGGAGEPAPAPAPDPTTKFAKSSLV